MSLYRIYRPQTFEDVVGQEHVARTLRNALTAQPPRVAHAYLFTGPRGIGKTTNARLLAKCLNCENGPTPTPCNQCDFCVRVSKNQPVMDLVEIDAASNTGVDNVRENIIDKVNMAPAQGRYRVTIIDEVHMLSASSFNALLKTIEEPPPHAIFILATTETHKVPQTIISRCQRFDFRRVTPTDIAGRLQYVAQAEKMVLQPDAAKLIARHADGALRDGLTLLEQVSAFSAEEISAADVRLVLGGVPQELLDGLVESVGHCDAAGVFGLIEKAVEEGASFAQLARDLTAYARDLLLLTVGYAGDENLSAPERASRARHAELLGRARLERLITLLRDAEKEMRSSTDHRLLLELTLVRSCDGATLPAALPAPMPAPRPALKAREAAPAGSEANGGAANSHAANDHAANGGAATAPLASLPPLRKPIRENVLAPKAKAEEPAATEPEHTAKVSEGAETDEGQMGNVEGQPENVKGQAGNVEEQPENVKGQAGNVEEQTGNDEGQAGNDEGQAGNDEGQAETGAESAPAPRKKQGRRIHDFDSLVELWPAVLMRIRKKIGVTAVAYLHDARPIGFSDEEIILEFSKEFHHAKATEASKRLPFEEKINETLDKPRLLRMQMAAPAPKFEPAPQPEEDDDDDDDDLTGGADIIEYAQNMFGAEIMGRSG